MPSTHHGVLLHVIFSTKNRLEVLHKDWRDDLYAYMGGTAQDHKATILQSGGIEDHVHLLIKIHPSFAISNTVKLIKGNSSRWINENDKTSAKFEWQKGYGAFSVSQSLLEIVKRYVANQQEHHSRQPFEDEYFALLRKHQIDFDKRFVFDQEVIA